MSELVTLLPVFRYRTLLVSWESRSAANNSVFVVVLIFGLILSWVSDWSTPQEGQSQNLAKPSTAPGVSTPQNIAVSFQRGGCVLSLTYWGIGLGVNYVQDVWAPTGPVCAVGAILTPEGGGGGGGGWGFSYILQLEGNTLPQNAQGLAGVLVRISFSGTGIGLRAGGGSRICLEPYGKDPSVASRRGPAADPQFWARLALGPRRGWRFGFRPGCCWSRSWRPPTRSWRHCGRTSRWR